MRLCFDAGPLENSHRERGIGFCTYHLLNALTPSVLARHGLEVQYLKRRPLEYSLACNLGARFAPRSRLAEWTATNGRLPSKLTERWKALETTLALPREVSATGADAFFTADPYAIALSRKFRTIALIHDFIPLRFPGQYLSRRMVIARSNYAWQLRRIRRADHLIAVSEATRRDAIELLGISPDRITVVPHGVDARLFRPTAPDTARSLVGERYGISRPYFFYVGGFDYRKNVSALLGAFLEVADAHDILLVIAGLPGKFGVHLRREAEGRHRADRIRWLGYVPEGDLRALYAGSLALVYPSLYEGFGLPVLEAMSCGAPVLTSPLSSLPEVAGDAALYVDPGSPAELAAALRRLAAEPALRAELRERGLERAQRFSWTDTAERVLQVCRAVAEGNNRGRLTS
jgi:glycosyltransferase involved in cell wall biosynthesis